MRSADATRSEPPLSPADGPEYGECAHRNISWLTRRCRKCRAFVPENDFGFEDWREE